MVALGLFVITNNQPWAMGRYTSSERPGGQKSRRATTRDDGERRAWRREQRARCAVSSADRRCQVPFELCFMRYLYGHLFSVFEYSILNVHTCMLY